MCPSNPRTNDGTCGPTIPALQKHGLTAAPAKQAKGNRRAILKDTEALLAVIETCLATKQGDDNGI